MIPASYADTLLKRDARKVPAPAGLVFKGYGHQSYDTFSLAPDEEADVSYDDPSMSCDQLRAAWLAILAKYHVRVDTQDSNARQIFIADLVDTVRTDLLTVISRAVEPAHAAIWISPARATRADSPS